jgi:WD40 repeat protein
MLSSLFAIAIRLPHPKIKNMGPRKSTVNHLRLEAQSDLWFLAVPLLPFFFSFTDPNTQRRCSTLQWNPENATQLVVASDDDRSPSLQVWDLRNSVSPLKELSGHSKGVLAMAWCPMDSSLLLTCAKDNSTFCWDTFSGEVLYELPASNNWNFDVQWSPRTPGVLSTSSFDGNISIYNIEACSRSTSNEMSFGREIRGMDLGKILI